MGIFLCRIYWISGSKTHANLDTKRGVTALFMFFCGWTFYDGWIDTQGLLVVDLRIMEEMDVEITC
jgi:hypothetical protein